MCCVVTACSAQASTHKPSTSLSALIARTASQECARFTAADKAITSGTELDMNLAELAGSLHTEGPAWLAQLGRAEKQPPGIPHGGNRANDLAADIAGAALPLAMADLDNNLGRAGALNSDWRTALRRLGSTRAACNAG